jgi:hypothetical protein
MPTDRYQTFLDDAWRDLIAALPEPPPPYMPPLLLGAIADAVSEAVEAGDVARVLDAAHDDETIRVGSPRFLEEL